MKSYSSKDVIEILKKDGWELVKIVGSHHQFKHKIKKGKVTVPHPEKDIRKGTLKSICKQAQIDFKDFSNEDSITP